MERRVAYAALKKDYIMAVKSVDTALELFYLHMENSEKIVFMSHLELRQTILSNKTIVSLPSVLSLFGIFVPVV